MGSCASVSEDIEHRPVRKSRRRSAKGSSRGDTLGDRTDGDSVSSEETEYKTQGGKQGPKVSKPLTPEEIAHLFYRAPDALPPADDPKRKPAEMQESWNSFFNNNPEAVTMLLNRWMTLTHHELDPRVTSYCGGDNERWKDYVMQQVVVQRAASGLCLCDIDEIYLRAVASTMMVTPKSEPLSQTTSHMGGNAPSSADGHQPEAAVTLSVKEDSLAHSTELGSTLTAMHLLLTGEAFPQLMEELGIKNDLHLLYLIHRLQAALPDLTSQKLRRSSSRSALPNNASAISTIQVDEWSISLASWRFGWIRLGAFNREEQQRKAYQLQADVDNIEISSKEFSDFYSFMWVFIQSSPASAQGASPARASPAKAAGSPGRLNDVSSTASSPANSRKTIQKDDAMVIWSTIVGETKWKFIRDWIAYLEDPNEKIYSRVAITIDQWRQLLEFMTHHRDEQSFASYDSAMSSWPSILDEFVDWMTRHRGLQTKDTVAAQS